MLTTINNFGREGSIIPKKLDRTGNLRFKVTTAPALEPVSVAELKIFARIDGSTEDTLLGEMIQAARENTEKYLGRALITQTITASLDFWGDVAIQLPRPPLISVTQIHTLNESDVQTVYSASNYYLITDEEPGKVIIKNGASPPTTTTRQKGGIQIVYVAGYGAASTDVPQGIRMDLMLWAASIYENRVISKEPPPEAKSSLDSFRIYNI